MTADSYVGSLRRKYGLYYSTCLRVISGYDACVSEQLITAALVSAAIRIAHVYEAN